MSATDETDPLARVRPIDGIVERMQRGIEREENFERIFKRYFRLVRHFFTQSGVPWEQAEDLTQETFLLVEHRIDSFRREASFETWLFKIARNVKLQAVRRDGAGKRFGEEVPLEGVGEDDPTRFLTRSPASGQPEALRQILAKEQIQVLFEALEEFPAQMRQCVTLRLTKGLRYREIAARLQLSVDAVKVQLSRGRRRLRRRIADHEL